MQAILARLREEPALVRTVVYGVMAALLHNSDSVSWAWVEEGVALALLALAGIEIRGRVTPTTVETEGSEIG